MNRSRNLWSVEEDTTLRRLVESCEKGKVDWRVIASYLPGRNNKDCRKRWHYRVSATMNLGPWSQGEDELLKMGIHRHGPHWSRVAQVVGTRNGDQCFKRWNDVLDPAIDRSPWTREEDRLLLLAIGEYGRAWKMIVDTYFPGRTGLDAKNRHRQLTRKRKRESKPSTKTTKTTIKKEQQPQQQFTSVQSPLPQLTPTSLSPALSAVGTPSIILQHQHQQQHQHIDVSPRNSEMHLHVHDRLVGGDDATTERSLSVPPASSSSYWEVPLEGLFSPPLPTATPETPYSSCSSISTSHYEGSLSSFKGEPQPPYESGELLMHGVPAVPYPYYIPTPHERSLEIQPHLSYLPNHAHHPHAHSHHGHEENILGLRPGMVMSPPFHGQGVFPVHHHQPYALDGIVM
ncbi:hypothetical protein TMatcc_010562 [Talaromyces marneffei ATCC 18224]|uniref:DNA-binding protein eta2, putative n=3 Tax=Talaromyces marneffei TaxID=37727 RepID=B6QV42_TALMQ|nr:uncharacterized protein EYB26_009660 [Talaromyces marneffei]EEA18894.1 DNA-binding protein eta2, putative [Talaromyces marneffei ATCC 18224]KAE8548603.1 hypothetical protein EYB25_008984 [Talaromyces marneffei]QGA21946.1 hypothetical protein EYB26_009660 [Talaromyces marneffei]